MKPFLSFPIVLLALGLSLRSSAALTLSSVPRGRLLLATSTAPRTSRILARAVPPVRSLATHAKKGGGSSSGDDFLQSVSASLPSPGTLLFWGTLLLFPGFFFGLVSNFLTALVVVPLLAFAAFKFWYSVTVQEAACPQCGAAVVGFKNGDPFNCVSCGEPLVADVGASPPRWLDQTVFPADDDQDDFRGGGGGGGSPIGSTQPPPKKSRSEPGGFVDVEIL